MIFLTKIFLLRIYWVKRSNGDFSFGRFFFSSCCFSSNSIYIINCMCEQRSGNGRANSFSFFISENMKSIVSVIPMQTIRKRNRDRSIQIYFNWVKIDRKKSIRSTDDFEKKITHLQVITRSMQFQCKQKMRCIELKFDWE